METKFFSRRGVVVSFVERTTFLFGTIVLVFLGCQQAELGDPASKESGQPTGKIGGMTQENSTEPRATSSGSETTPSDVYNGMHITEIHKTLQGKIDRFGFLMSPGTSDGIMYYDLKDTDLILILFVSEHQIATAIDFGYVWPTKSSLRLNELPKQVGKIEVFQ